jgi:hypothetical protein
VQPVEGGHGIGHGPFGDPDRVVVGVDLLADGCPFVQAVSPLKPEDEHGASTVAKIGGVSGMDADGIVHAVDDLLRALEPRRRSEIDREKRLDPVRGGLVKHHPEVGLRLVVLFLGAIPADDQPVDPYRGSLGDLLPDDARVRRVVGRDRPVRGFTRAQHVRRPPHVVVDQHGSRALCLRRLRR